MLNTEVFDTVRDHNAKILVVTKYWDTQKTLDIFNSCKWDYTDIFFWLWENRTKILQEKWLSRENIHFIGNIQSREIKNIVHYCSTIHSLGSVKHAQKIENVWIYTEAFIQIKLDPKKDIWIPEKDVADFLWATRDFTYLKIIWISGMGATNISEDKKREEFRTLIKIRDIYLPHWLISAGTSQDYQIALKEWIDIVRVWSLAIKTAA